MNVWELRSALNRVIDAGQGTLPVYLDNAPVKDIFTYGNTVILDPHNEPLNPSQASKAYRSFMPIPVPPNWYRSDVRALREIVGCPPWDSLYETNRRIWTELLSKLKD